MMKLPYPKLYIRLFNDLTFFYYPRLFTALWIFLRFWPSSNNQTIWPRTFSTIPFVSISSLPCTTIIGFDSLNRLNLAFIGHQTNIPQNTLFHIWSGTITKFLSMNRPSFSISLALLRLLFDKVESSCTTFWAIPLKILVLHFSCSSKCTVLQNRLSQCPWVLGCFFSS